MQASLCVSVTVSILVSDLSKSGNNTLWNLPECVLCGDLPSLGISKKVKVSSGLKAQPYLAEDGG